MSRVQLESKDENLEIVVGWDNPLISFFISVCTISMDPDVDPEYIEFKDRWSKSDVIDNIKKYAKGTPRTLAVIRAIMADIDPIKVVTSKLDIAELL